MVDSNSCQHQKSQQQIANQTGSPIEIFRAKLILRYGQGAIKKCGRIFRIMDDDRSRTLNMAEFKKGVNDQLGCKITDDQLHTLFGMFDEDKSGQLNCDEFLLALRGPMKDTRLKLVDEAFKKLDKTGDGVITLEDIREVYSVKHHPKYQSGEWTEDRCLQQFLDTFGAKDNKDDAVSKTEFMDYYCGVSASIDNDAYFDLMMRNAWKI